MLSYSEALLLLEEYEKTRLFKPWASWPIREIQNRSYARSALRELMRWMIEEADLYPYYIYGRKHRSPLEVVLDYMEEMDRLYELSEWDDARRMFNIAYDLGQDVLYLFNSRKENDEHV